MVWGAVAAAAAPAIASAFGKKKKYQVPLEPMEVTEARRRLNDFSKTGVYGDFTAGEDVGLGYGDYNATDIEQSGLSSLQSLLQSGIPDEYRMGNEALSDLLATSPQQIESQFTPFKVLLDRATRDSTDAYKRATAYGGNLYSTAAMKGLGDIQDQSNEQSAAKLAELTNAALNRRLQAVPLAFQSAESQEALKMGRVGASQQYGGLIRQLNDAAIKSRDAEILRRRQELQLPIDAAKTVLGSAPTYGIPDVTQPSPFQNVLDMVGNIGGQYLGNELSLQQYKRYFPNGSRVGKPTVFSY